MEFEEFCDKIIEDISKLSAETKMVGLEASPELGWTSWPAEAWHVEYFGATEQRRIIFEYLKKLIAKGMSFEEIGKLFVYPSRLLYLGLLPGRKSQNSMTKDKRRELAKISFEIYKTMKCGSAYNHNGQHKILRNEDVLEIIDNGKVLRRGINCKSIAKNIHLYAFAIVENLYGYRRANGCEIHGVYDTSRGKYLIIDLFDLNSPYLESTKNLKYNKIRIIEKVSGGFELSIDNFQHIGCKGNWPESIDEIYCLADGKNLTEEEFEKFLNDISDMAVQTTAEIIKMSYKERIEILLKNLYFSFRGLSDAIGEVFFKDEFLDKLRKENIPIDENPAKRFEGLGFEEVYRIIRNKLHPLI